ncbi:MAG: LysR substrate-binding domain-containing protein [Gammaproteobacteria bacterium]|nr:LysR substrate-binding domain-containing protein [Gammaproteobacteria bacterium]
MNLRDLEYLIAVAETQNFRQAAQRCFVSQPTLSGQIKKLEDELGITLFERTNRSVEITPAGYSVLEHARLIMEQKDAIKLLAQSFQDPIAGPLNLGAIPTISPYLMPLILKPLQQAYPQMRLVLAEEQTDILLQRLHDHEIDAAILATEHPETDFVNIPLYREPFWLAHPQKHPFYTQEEITQDDLDNTELLLLAEGHCLAQQALEVCHMEERQQQGEWANLRASSLETLLQLVAAGYGTTLVPALALSGSWTTGSGIITRELNLPNTWRQVSLFYRPTFPRTQALQAISQTLKANLPNTVIINE